MSYDCNACGKEITRDTVRYHCLDCPDYDLCAVCEEKDVHEGGKHVLAKMRQ